MTSKSIETVINAHKNTLMAVKGVVDVGVGEFQERPCIKVMIDRRTRKLVKQIPKSLDGFAVIIEETGEFKARQRIRPF